MDGPIRMLLTELVADVRSLITDQRDLIAVVRQLIRANETIPAPAPSTIEGAKPAAIRAVLQMHIRRVVEENDAVCFDDAGDSEKFIEELSTHLVTHFELKLKP